jgi:hypothetical protein
VTCKGERAQFHGQRFRPCNTLALASSKYHANIAARQLHCAEPLCSWQEMPAVSARTDCNASAHQHRNQDIKIILCLGSTP